jgi:lysophospholipase L1-like esterase
MICVVFVIILMRICVGILGLDVKEIVSCLPRPNMWIEDQDIGYRNKPFLNRQLFGNIRGMTDGYGFRSLGEPFQNHDAKALRIVGIGDSVMWGNKVNLEDTFMGRLGKLPAGKHGKVDIINAGVVGYSTLQEKIFYEKFILNLQPDIVLINFCSNDWLPTEDPFGNLRTIYLNYLNRESKEYSSYYTVAEQKTLRSIIQNFRNTGIMAWSELMTMREDQDVEAVLRKVLLERPIEQMSEIMRENKTTLIYLFIPDTYPDKKSRQTVSALHSFMQRKSIKYIDLSDQLIDAENLKDRYEIKRNIRFEPVMEYLSANEVFGIFKPRYLRPYNPIENIRRISLFAHFFYLNHFRNYIDTIGHLSVKGHKVVARRIASYLEEEPRCAQVKKLPFL